MAGFLRHGRTVALRALAQQHPAEAARLARYAGEAQAVDGDEAGRVEREAQRCDELVAELGPGQGDAVQARADQLRRVLQRLREPANQKTTDAPVSFEDPDCRFGDKAKDVCFLGYKVHQALDPDSRLVLSVETLPGNANEAVEVGTLVGGEVGGLPEGAAVIGDALYGNTTAAGQVAEHHGVPVFAGMAIARVSDRFTYDAPADQMVCPEGKRSIGSIEPENGRRYYFSVPDCAGCPVKARCLTKSELASAQRRRVYLSRNTATAPGLPGERNLPPVAEREPLTVRTSSAVPQFRLDTGSSDASCSTGFRRIPGPASGAREHWRRGTKSKSI